MTDLEQKQEGKRGWANSQGWGDVSLEVLINVIILWLWIKGRKWWLLTCCHTFFLYIFISFCTVARVTLKRTPKQSRWMKSITGQKNSAFCGKLSQSLALCEMIWSGFEVLSFTEYKSLKHPSEAGLIIFQPIPTSMSACVIKFLPSNTLICHSTNGLVTKKLGSSIFLAEASLLRENKALSQTKCWPIWKKKLF